MRILTATSLFAIINHVQIHAYCTVNTESRKKKHNVGCYGRKHNDITMFATNERTPESRKALGFGNMKIMPPVVSSHSRATKTKLNMINGMHENMNYVLTSVLLLSNFGIRLEQNTMIGKALSAPLATMALALIVANLGIIPFSSPIYGIVNKYLVPLAVPMLLFDSDLKRVVNDTGSLLKCFFVGAFATIVGTLITYPLIPLSSLGVPGEGWKVASALAARHIGGAINFVAVADTLGISGSTVSAAIAADNVVVALYFAFLFCLAKENSSQCSESEGLSSGELEQGEIDVVDPEDISSSSGQISLSTISSSFAVSSFLVYIGGVLTKAILPAGTSSLPLISILTVVGASSFPKFFSSLRATGTAIGILFMQMFFAASGAAGSIMLVLRNAPSLFLFSVSQIGIHFLTLMGLGKYILKLDDKELYLASNANVGGPTTAAAMAQAKNWTRLVMPALLIGIFGYATATAIALGLGGILVRLPVIVR